MRIAARLLAGISAILLAVVLVGLAPGAAEAAGRSSTERIGDRSYELYRPANLRGDVPLVVVLHGAFRDGNDAKRRFGWDPKADREKFVVAYPTGVNGFWNAGSCCGTASAGQVDDVGFIRRVVADVSRKTSIDPRRIYVTGMSNGGMLTYRLACETRLFAAAAPVAANLMVPCHRSASVLHIHGTGDQIVSYQPVPAIIAGFRQRGHCAAPAARTRGVVTRSIATCPAGRSVELITVRDAGHQWPGGGGAPGLGTPSKAVNATSEIWRFFSAR